MFCHSKKIRASLAVLFLALFLIPTLALLPVFAEELTYHTVTRVVDVENKLDGVSDPSAYGYVTVSGTADPGDPNRFVEGTQITLTASSQPDRPGYEFKRWVFGTESTSYMNPLNTTVTGDMTYTAVFGPIEYSITYVDNKHLLVWNPGDPPVSHTYGSSTVLPTPDTSGVQGYTFGGWMVSSTEVQATKYAAGDSLGGTAFSSNITAEAIWTPKPFDVTRVDVYRPASGSETELGRVTEPRDYDTKNISGKDFEEVLSYRGKWFNPDDTNAYTVLESVTANPSVNVIYRYYTPRTYKIVYENCTPSVHSATTHTFGVDSSIHPPVKDGYTFKGWKIGKAATDDWTLTEFDVEPDATGFWQLPGDAYDSTAWNSTDLATITLTAVWEANEYNVLYKETEKATNVSSLVNTRKFNEAFSVPDLTRPGYTFLGWKIEGSDADPQTGYVIEAETHPETVTLVACWLPLTYTVTPVSSNGDYTVTGGSTGTVTATYDAAFPEALPVPQCAGFTFLGYFEQYNGGGKQFYLADGTVNPEATWTTTSNAEIYAHWARNSYAVTVNVGDELGTDLSAQVEITVNGEAYDPSRTYPFETALTVVITVKTDSTGKLVKWKGSAIPHTASFTVNETVGSSDLVLAAVLLPRLATPELTVDYEKELLGGLTAGTYRIRTDDDEWSFTVDAEGNVSPLDTTHSKPTSLRDLFGKTLKITRRGDGSTASDSDEQSIQLAARPAAPVKGPDIRSIVAGADSKSIRIEMNDSGTVYEFAYTRALETNPESITTWGESALLDDLRAGTPYYVYVRVKAKAGNHPHGEMYTEQVTTQKDRFLEDWIDQLNRDFADYGDGENVSRLIREAEKSAKGLEPAVDFNERLDAIRQNVQDHIAFEKKKDDALTRLREHYNRLVSTWKYADPGVNELTGILDTAVAAVNAAHSAEVDVSRIENKGIADMNEVRINYLSSITPDSELNLYSREGLYRETVLTASRNENEQAIREKIAAAVRKGTIVPVGSMTAGAARDLLYAMDAAATYKMSLTGNDSTDYGTLEFRLLIPESLRTETGFTVAFYDEKTETVTVLDTRREGNQLVFTAEKAENFVVFCDHVVRLTGLTVALAVLVLLQFIAILIILIRRRKNAGSARANAFALPLLLFTVRFLPENTLTVVIVLAGLALIFQAILIYLLFTSSVFRRRKDEPEDREPTPVYPEEEPTVEEESEEEPPLATLTDNDLPANRYDENAEPTEGETENAEEVFAYGEEEEPADGWYGDNSFIEPAADPRYSLPQDDEEEAEPEWNSGAASASIYAEEENADGNQPTNGEPNDPAQSANGEETFDPWAEYPDAENAKENDDMWSEFPDAGDAADVEQNQGQSENRDPNEELWEDDPKPKPNTTFHYDAE